MRNTLAAASFAALLAVPAAPALAQQSPHSLTGNVGLYSQYIFRGVSQTDRKPALQGGFDYAHSSGWYAGTWASNISWLNDSPGVTGYTSSSLEWDFYGGYKGSFGELGYDLGLLYYAYPGRIAPGFVKADTLEAYGALSWKWFTAKYSHSLDNKTFGVANSDGTWYLDLGVAFPVTDKLTVSAHYGIQEFKGSIAGVSNDSIASFKDWKIGVSYTLPKDFTIGAFFTGTDMNAAQTAFYTNAAGRYLGKDTLTIYLQKTF